MMETEGGRVDIGDDVARSKEADDDDEASEAESTMRATTAHRLPTTHTQTHKRVSTTRIEFKLEIDRERALASYTRVVSRVSPILLLLLLYQDCLAVWLFVCQPTTSAGRAGQSRVPLAPLPIERAATANALLLLLLLRLSDQTREK